MSAKVNIVENTPTKSWSDAEWKNWHGTVAKSLGKSNAKILFMKAWKLRGTPKANTVDLRSYLKDNGISLNSTNVIGDIADFSYGIADDIGDMFGFASTTAIVVGGILVLSLGFLVISIARKPAEFASLAKSVK